MLPFGWERERVPRSNKTRTRYILRLRNTLGIDDVFPETLEKKLLLATILVAMAKNCGKWLLFTTVK